MYKALLQSCHSSQFILSIFFFASSVFFIFWIFLCLLFRCCCPYGLIFFFLWLQCHDESILPSFCKTHVSSNPLAMSSHFFILCCTFWNIFLCHCNYCCHDCRCFHCCCYVVGCHNFVYTSLVKPYPFAWMFLQPRSIFHNNAY